MSNVGSAFCSADFLMVGRWVGGMGCDKQGVIFQMGQW